MINDNDSSSNHDNNQPNSNREKQQVEDEWLKKIREFSKELSTQRPVTPVPSEIDDDEIQVIYDSFTMDKLPEEGTSKKQLEKRKSPSPADAQPAPKRRRTNSGISATTSATQKEENPKKRRNKIRRRICPREYHGHRLRRLQYDVYKYSNEKKEVETTISSAKLRHIHIKQLHKKTTLRMEYVYEHAITHVIEDVVDVLSAEKRREIFEIDEEEMNDIIESVTPYKNLTIMRNYLTNIMANKLGIAKMPPYLEACERVRKKYFVHVGNIAQYAELAEHTYRVVNKLPYANAAQLLVKHAYSMRGWKATAYSRFRGIINPITVEDPANMHREQSFMLTTCGKLTEVK